MTALLDLQSVTSGYGEVRILHDVSLDVAAGSITALVGSNGAGKTTLMRAIAGLLPLTAGRILLDGVDIGLLPTHRRIELGLALVPEGRLIFPDFTVEENLKIGAIARHARPERPRRMEEMYELFPRLRERSGQAGGTLSGGEQQMLALARGMMAGPRLLLLDEPSLGLAPIVVEQLFDVIPRIREAGVTVFIVEQDVRASLELADIAYVMENGRIVQAGPAAKLLDDPSIKEAYLGL
jgi:branched-chain amino acid transport system ATP-binding protein